MTRVVLRATATLFLSALVGSVIVFLLLRMLRGDIATVILGQNATPEAIERLRSEFGLDRSWAVQYLDWMTGMLRGDLGRSYAARYDIFAEIRSRMGLTFSLSIASLVLSSVFALIAGTYSAINVRKVRGGLLDVGAQLGMAVPTFWAGLLLIGYFSVRLGWFPAGGYVPWTRDPIGAIRTLSLPVLALSIPIAAMLTRYVRSSMLDVLNEDFIRTAMAKGRTLPRAAVVHGVRNASVSLVTVATLQLGSLIAGAVVIENVFTLPGLGRMLMDAVGGREATVVQSLVFVILLMILLLNYLMDLGYGLLDPRIRDSQGADARG